MVMLAGDPLILLFAKLTMKVVIEKARHVSRGTGPRIVHEDLLTNMGSFLR